MAPPGLTMTTPVLRVRDLRVEFRSNQAALTAVNGVDLDLDRGEVLGLVGESGSGKSVTGLAMMGLIDPPGHVTGGSVRLAGQELVGQAEHELRSVRGRRLAMIFQDPTTTLNPVLRIDTQMIEALRAHERISVRSARRRVSEALEKVGIPAASERMYSYPHQFSGGMRQRIAIAIALLHNPDVLIADEATTALDVSRQAQVLSEIQSLAEAAGTAMIWITHDLSVVAGLADRIAVMYAGRIVETGRVADILTAPAHPYTAGLIASVPRHDRSSRRLAQIRGSAPSLSHIPPGCAFSDRCDFAAPACRAAPPPTIEGKHGRSVRCLYPLVSDEAHA